MNSSGRWQKRHQISRQLRSPGRGLANVKATFGVNKPGKDQTPEGSGGAGRIGLRRCPWALG